ncbi:uncharacterized protein METZ01_LOCUS6483 [marine metagenome]|uniref:Uncharacterized protein n=1 Tax=marine metagenome TaxID=408172 RepID=A0A381NGV2_9ZZZZ
MDGPFKDLNPRAPNLKTGNDNVLAIIRH